MSDPIGWPITIGYCVIMTLIYSWLLYKLWKISAKPGGPAEGGVA